MTPVSSFKRLTLITGEVKIQSATGPPFAFAVRGSMTQRVAPSASLRGHYILESVCSLAAAAGSAETEGGRREHCDIQEHRVWLTQHLLSGRWRHMHEHELWRDAGLPAAPAEFETVMSFY